MGKEERELYFNRGLEFLKRYYRGGAAAGYMLRLLGSIAQGAPWASGLPVPRSLCNRWSMVCSRGGDRAACVKHCLSDLSGATGWCKVDCLAYMRTPSSWGGAGLGACSCGGNASRTAYYTRDLAETIIESLYPKKFYHNAPSMTSSAFVTKNLKKSEWVNHRRFFYFSRTMVGPYQL